MESNLEQQTPKLNVTNISSAVFGKDGPALGEESKIGKLSRILRTTRLKVNNLEKIVGKQEENIVINSEKITRLKNILQNQKSDIGEKLPGSGKDDLNTTLLETNRTLVEIQKQLAYDFAMRAVEEKKEAEDEKEATSKSRFKREETALEKSAKKVVSTVKSATKKIVSPIGNIFQKLLAFIGILGKGIAVNAAFEWFKDEENQKKITKIFNILKENWKLLANIFGTIIAVGAILKVAGAITTIGTVLSLLANPIILKLLAVAGTAAGIVAIANKLKNITAGGEEYRKLYEDNNEKLNKAGVAQPSSPTSKETMLLTPNPEGGYFEMVRQGVDQRTGQFGNLTTGSINPDTGKLYATPAQLSAFDAWKSEKLKIDNLDKKSGELPEPRKLGGPVTAGQPYLVGEGGPELMIPNIDGTVINNMKTEKIYQMIASGKKSRTRIVELPPQTIEGPKPEIKLPQGPATKAPKISSSNPLDGYRSVTSEIYGIMV